jgi:hypothetical protein
VDGSGFVYTGAPDECSHCFTRGRVVKMDGVGCPVCRERIAEEELWFGPIHAPFRFQGE